MPRQKENSNYNSDQVMKDFMAAVVDAFGSYDDRDRNAGLPGLNAVAAEFNITALKACKLLITAGVYSTCTSRLVLQLHTEGNKIDQIMKITGLSRASVHSYLPYAKIPYKMKELSANAERIRLYRERKRKCIEFSKNLSILPKAVQESFLWNILIDLQGCVFLTAKGLNFTYKIRGGEMFVNRKSKSITQTTVFMAYIRAKELMEVCGCVSGPKKLGTFGASYLYPIFVRIGVITINAE